MVDWRGHQATTSLVLAALLKRCAGEAAPALSRGESVLFTVCEFWAAAMNRELQQHLGKTADARLRAAEESFAEIGALRVAATLRRGRIDLTEATPPIPLQQVATALEEDLARTKDAVDDLIAEFAAEQTWHRL